MNYSIETYELLNEYRKVAANNLHQKIRFYRNNESELNKIHITERIEIVKDFLFALFQNGEYQEFISRSDILIGQLYDMELFPDFDKHVVSDLLFHKAASLYNLDQIDEAEAIMTSLILMQPQNHFIHEVLLSKMYQKKLLPIEQRLRGWVIVLVLIAAILCLSNTFGIMQKSHPSFDNLQTISWSFLAFAVFFWFFSFEYLKFISKRKALDFMAALSHKS